jgi:hypothetical protein
VSKSLPSPDGPRTERDPDREGEYGPADRELFEKHATALYEIAVTESGLSRDDERLAGDQGQAALQLLLELGLLASEPVTGRLLAKDPTGSQAHVVTPLGQRGADLLTESARWAKAFGGLAQTWRRSPIAASGPFTELRGLPTITRFIESAADDATTELLTAQPQTARGMAQLSASLQRERQALDRGVSLRTLYQHAARRSSATDKYVRAVSTMGAEVRTLDEFFKRMIVVDRQLVIIPSAETNTVAIAIREPSVVAYLVDVFERSWERARPFGDKGSSTMRDIAAEQRAMTIRMLIEGHADPASAKRLGVSPRTYAGYVADLKGEYDAETRFQLGYYMGQKGVTGQDPSSR